MKSPFKFLDSYTKDDKDIFFGREREVEELYHRVFEGKIMLVYGVSGTGKSSLIHCGLANKFQDSDWLPINVRRAGDMVRSMAFAINQAAITPMDGEIATPAQFKKAVRSLYLDHYKPIFFVFDQFEELFIFGNREEKKAFIQIVKALTESDLQCRFMFVLREEYLAGITEFERVIPNILVNRVRIEKMTLANAKQVIEGPCKVSGIEVEEGFSDEMLEKLSPGSAEVELTYLQVYLDKIYRLATGEGKGTIKFHKDLLQQVGNVSDLLGSFLDEQIELLPDPDSALAVLKSFVSVKGTKRQMSPEEVQDYAQTLGKPMSESTLQELLQTLIQLRILRDKDQNNRYELRHDALATKIYEKITLVEKELLEVRNFIENAHDNYRRRHILLSALDLSYIAPYEDKMYLSGELKHFVEQSKSEIWKARRRRMRLTIAASIILFALITGFAIYSYKAMKEAELQTRIEKSRSIAKSSLSIVDDDPTLAYLLAENAYNLYPTIEAESAILNSYKRAPFCTQIFCDQYVISEDKKYIAAVSADDNIVRIYNYKGKLLGTCVGHKGHIEMQSMKFTKDSKYLFTRSITDSTCRIWELEGKPVSVYKFTETPAVELVENKIVHLKTQSFEIFNLYGDKINVHKFNSTLTSYIFNNDVIVITTNDSSTYAFNLSNFKEIRNKKLTNNYILNKITSNTEAVLLSSKINDNYEDYFIWNIKNNKLIEIKNKPIGYYTSFYLIGNLFVERNEVNENAYYNILDCEGKVVYKTPIQYAFSDSKSTEKYLVFENYYNAIIYDIENKKIIGPFDSNVYKLVDDFVVIPKIGDAKSIQLFHLISNRVIKNFDAKFWDSDKINYIPQLKILVYNTENNNIVFENFRNQKIKTQNTFFLNRGIHLNDSFYLLERSNDNEIINSLTIWNIDTTRFNSFDLSKYYGTEKLTRIEGATGKLIEFYRILGPRINLIGFSPKENYIITSDKYYHNTIIWSIDGNKYKEFDFKCYLYKFSKSGKYLALSNHEEFDKPGKLYIFNFPELNLLYSETTNAAGIEFKETKDTLCTLYSNSSIKILDNNFSKIDEWYVGSLEYLYNNNYDWVPLKDNFLIGAKRDNRTSRLNKVIAFKITTKDSIILYNDSVKNDFSFGIWGVLFINKSNIIVSLGNSFIVKDITNKTRTKINSNYDLSRIFLSDNDSIITLVNSYVNTGLMNNKLDNSIYNFYKWQTPYGVIEHLKIPSYELINSYSVNGLFSIISTTNDRVLRTNDRILYYNDFRGNVIIDFETDINSKFLPNCKHVLFLDYENKRLINFPLNPEEIIKRVSVNKEFGELREITNEEKNMYGIPLENK